MLEWRWCMWTLLFVLLWFWPFDPWPHEAIVLGSINSGYPLYSSWLETLGSPIFSSHSKVKIGTIFWIGLLISEQNPWETLLHLFRVGKRRAFFPCDQVTKLLVILLFLPKRPTFQCVHRQTDCSWQLWFQMFVPLGLILKKTCCPLLPCYRIYADWMREGGCLECSCLTLPLYIGSPENIFEQSLGLPSS